MSENTRRRGAVLGTVLAVLLVAVGTTVLVRSTRSGPPAVLHLAGTAAPRAAEAALAPTATTGGDYQLVGTLPADAPDTPAYTVTSATGAAAVARLADALDAGTPTRDGQGWRSDKGLVVNADGSWWWSVCPDAVVSSDGTTARCATAGGTGTATAGTVTAEPGATGEGSAGGSEPATPAPLPKATAEPLPAPSPPPTVDEDTVLSTAGPVFDAVGLDVGDARVDGATAVVDPVVGGLPTWGLSTRVAVAADGSITDATGWLVGTVRGDTYPLRTARQVYDELPPLPRPAIACPVGPSGEDGCPEPQPVQVTGARRGLAVYPQLEGTPVLVPAWLFAVKGSSEPVVGIAVDARYLDTGGEPSTRPTPGGSAEPAPPPAEPGAVEGSSATKPAVR